MEVYCVCACVRVCVKAFMSHVRFMRLNVSHIYWG